MCYILYSIVKHTEGIAVAHVTKTMQRTQTIHTNALEINTHTHFSKLLKPTKLPCIYMIVLLS